MEVQSFLFLSLPTFFLVLIRNLELHYSDTKRMEDICYKPPIKHTKKSYQLV